MGTSSNKASPSTPNWRIPKAILGKADYDPRRQNQELWKAALADRSGSLRKELTDPTIAHLCNVVGAMKNPADAITKFESHVAKAGKANFILDMAKRAFIRSVAAKSGPDGFASELFSEVVSYYASRDLPSFIGEKGRISKPIDSIRLKRALRDITKAYALSVKVRTDQEGWREYIGTVIDQITRGGIDE